MNSRLTRSLASAGRLGGIAAAVLATVVATSLLPNAVRTEPGAGSGKPSPGGAVRMNEIQFIGAHNAYHRELQGAELAAMMKVDPTYPEWGFYSHAAIPDLLGRQHVRGLELDLLPDPQGGLYQYPLLRKAAGLGPIDDPEMAQPGMKVMHVADVDFNTTCNTLVACLKQVRQWSQDNPKHEPILIQLELKQTEDVVERAGGAVSPPWSEDLLGDIDAEIRSVFSETALITADDLRKPGRTLEESVLRYGWPTLDDARGKVMFFFDNGGPGAIRDMYLKGHPNLEGRAVFTRGNPGSPDAAITMVNDPRGANQAQIQDLVERGYLVRTRSDEPLGTVKNQDFAQLEAALSSGAQLVTTDFPSVGMAARWDSDYVAELPGGATVRCNPVSAPKNCRDDKLLR
ncbi:phosphatidylinositol-specific phospholipase C1-like protein [Micromonospora krabiensis]|uniref:Phosphoinositide phospholipase C, Ca2+-dependent n=1 Tax=Micromonospora krabiensis TaxID=307121 RepID=A0A1C3MWF9_9ACTN|nr:phosphatidylinositol-specific phospholipase C1-like protein [Micromonospora krabiensis]SBV24663.1 Phosphoinositide phospholipase C, Ca2+-dependent [Micromonospora krabiensis]